METSQLLKVILTSSLIAGILSAIVSAIISIKLKNLDYKNEYYKKIIEKRLEAYKYLETQIAILKSSVLDNDAKPYHLIFAYGSDQFYEFQQNLFAAISYSMWINQKTADKMDRMNDLFFKISRKINDLDEKALIVIGKDNYSSIAELRIELENLVRDDLIKLYNFKRLKKPTKNMNRIIELEK